MCRGNQDFALLCFALLCSAVLYMYLYTPLFAPTPNNLETVPRPVEDETERTMQIKVSNKRLLLKSVVHAGWTENICALYAQAPNPQLVMPRMTSNNGLSSSKVHAGAALSTSLNPSQLSMHIHLSLDPG